MQTNPDNSINTLRDLETKIDTYRGQITLQEQDISRNIKTLASQEYTIGQNELKNKEILSFIEANEKRKEELLKDIKSIEDNNEVLIKERDEARNELVYTKQLIENEKKLRDETMIDLDTRKSEVTNKEQVISDREKELQEKEEEVMVKHNKIKDLASQL